MRVCGLTQFELHRSRTSSSVDMPSEIDLLTNSIVLLYTTLFDQKGFWVLGLRALGFVFLSTEGPIIAELVTLNDGAPLLIIEPKTNQACALVSVSERETVIKETLLVTEISCLFS